MLLEHFKTCTCTVVGNLITALVSDFSQKSKRILLLSTDPVLHLP
jgi:hypothetical protein